MNRQPARLAALSLALLTATHTAPCVAAPRRPFPQHVLYAAGTIRPSHRTQAQQDDDARAAYNRWKTRYLHTAGTASDGTTLYRITTTASASSSTVSEGQGYGMLIAAFMAGHDPNAWVYFDGLWKYSRAHPSRIDARLMAYKIPAPPDDQDSAFDGDADIAHALLLAHRQWGSAGAVDYRSEAGEVLAGIMESTIGPDSYLPMLGDWVDPRGARYNQYTPRSSDFMPDHFRAFARATGSARWARVASACEAAVSSLQSRFSPGTGLLPDFTVPVSTTDHTLRPAPGGFLEGPYDGKYYYNACRDPWRIGTDALLNNSPASLAQARKITNWVRGAAGGVATNIRPGYSLNGTPIATDYFTSAFAAPLGVAAMTVPTGQSWLNGIYESVRVDQEGYYEDTLTLLCLLVMTGNLWDPGQPLAPSALRVTALAPTRVTLAWRDNSDDEAGFRVERSTNGTTFTQVLLTQPNVTTAAVTGLQAGATYWFRVRATNASGNSNPSNILRVTTPVPAAPESSGP